MRSNPAVPEGSLVSKPTWSYALEHGATSAFLFSAYCNCGVIRVDYLEYGGSTMLVLTRKSQESVVIGGSNGFERILKVTVIAIRGERVRLGIEADADVPVHRLEVWERIRANGIPKSPPGGATASIE
jgi:carbon storage regulator